VAQCMVCRSVRLACRRVHLARLIAILFRLPLPKRGMRRTPSARPRFLARAVIRVAPAFESARYAHAFGGETEPRVIQMHAGRRAKAAACASRNHAPGRTTAARRHPARVRSPNKQYDCEGQFFPVRREKFNRRAIMEQAGQFIDKPPHLRYFVVQP
jgi:hypothetical protein